MEDRIAIVGSRDYPRRQDVIDFVNTLADDVIVVTGGAAGVDTWAEEAARARKLRVTVFYPQWKLWGKAAGFRRNYWIVAYADRCMAFHYMNSRGTADTIRRFQAENKPVDVEEK